MKPAVEITLIEEQRTELKSRVRSQTLEHAQAGRQAGHFGYHGTEGMASQRSQAARDRDL